MIKAVIFDLDGTLLNTLDDLTDAVNYALRALGRAELDISAIRQMVGNGVPMLIERALGATGGDNGKDFEKCHALFKEFYGEHGADKTRLYDGIENALNALKKLGIKTAVVTNKYDEAAQELKKRLFDGVDFIVGTREGVRPKPSTDGVMRALDALGVARASAVYFGDGETDIATAKAAELPVVAVSWGFRDKALLNALEPDMIIDSPSEIVSAVRAIEKRAAEVKNAR